MYPIVKCPSIRSLIFIIIALIIIIAPASHASKTFQPVFHPALEVNKVLKAISIDGILDDPGWKDAAGSDNFVERAPGDNTEPLVETKFMITFDSDNLYIAFVCFDDPNTVRATMCQRDQFFGDDAVSVLIDTYGNASWAYKFMVNPYGVQRDYLWSNIIGEDGGYDIIWNSSARITETGYQVEMAIPFSSIRFPNKDIQEWKMDFQRNHPRETYRQYSWAAYDRNEQCWPCQWGTVKGIKNVHSGKGIEIMPTLIGTQSGFVSDPFDSDSPFEEGKVDREFSLGGKYSVNSDITIEATYNPDFSQIESDATQIDVNTPIALFFPERRPFFQEGRDIFRTLFNSFYTRTIHDPQFAAKLTGRTGKYRFGFLSAVDENTFYIIPLEESSVRPFNVGKSYVNIFRCMRAIGGSSQLGFIYNDRRFEVGGYNSVVALDQLIRLSRTYTIDGQYVVTFTKESDNSDLFPSLYTFNNGKNTIGFDGESFSGIGLISRLRRNARHWNFQINYDQVGRSYRTETGYDPWVNYRNLSSWSGYTIYFEKGLFERMTPQASTDTRWNFDGVRKWTHTNIAWSCRINYAQTNFSLSYNIGNELWDGIRFNDLWSVHFDIFSRFSEKLGCYLSVDKGVSAALNVLAKGNEISFSSGLNIKPLDRLIIEPDFDYLSSKHAQTDEKLYENYVFRTRLRFQATKALSLRLVIENSYWESLEAMMFDDGIEFIYLSDKHWSVDPLITYRISPFSVFYFGTTHSYDKLPYDLYPYYSSAPNPDHAADWRLSSRKFFMKLQYLFQV